MIDTCLQRRSGSSPPPTPALDSSPSQLHHDVCRKHRVCGHTPALSEAQLSGRGTLKRLLLKTGSSCLLGKGLERPLALNEDGWKEQRRPGSGASEMDGRATASDPDDVNLVLQPCSMDSMAVARVLNVSVSRPTNTAAAVMVESS